MFFFFLRKFGGKHRKKSHPPKKKHGGGQFWGKNVGEDLGVDLIFGSFFWWLVGHDFKIQKNVEILFGNVFDM